MLAVVPQSGARMPISPMDDFLAHQTPETFDPVYSGDRSFYGRYDFNCHGCSDELFLITGMGQYPNLGVLDAFVTISVADKHFCVRASRELGHDRLDTTVGPFGVEVLKGLETLRVTCAPNEWNLDFDLTWNGFVPALEEPVTYRRLGNRLTERAVTLDTSTVIKDRVYAYDAINRLDTIDDILGTLEAGKLADVLVVNGDPLQDLGVLENVLVVIHGGIVIRDET